MAKAATPNFDKLGIQTEPLSSSLAEQLGVKADSGVVISDVRANSAAASAGLEKGMVITHVGRKAVKSPAELQKQLDCAPVERRTCVDGSERGRKPDGDHPRRLRH